MGDVIFVQQNDDPEGVTFSDEQVYSDDLMYMPYEKAIESVSAAIDSAFQAGYAAGLEDYPNVGEVGVTPDFVRERMAGLLNRIFVMMGKPV